MYVLPSTLLTGIATVSPWEPIIFPEIDQSPQRQAGTIIVPGQTTALPNQTVVAGWEPVAL